MVEHLRHQLKVALMAHEDPTAGLSVRPAIKIKVGCSLAELLYGTMLHLPTTYFELSKSAPSSSPHTGPLHHVFGGCFSTLDASMNFL